MSHLFNNNSKIYSDDSCDSADVDTSVPVSADSLSGGKSKEQEEFSNLHPLRARLYDNVKLSLRTMDIVVAVVAVLLLVVFFVGVATGSGLNLN